MKKLRITVEGKAYEVLVEFLDEGDASTPAPSPSSRVRSASVEAPVASAPKPSSSAGAGSGAPGDVICPLAGKVVTIDVAVGQVVEAGAQVATIEAMKMNTFVYAEVGGKVTAILVEPGAGVEEGAPLLRLA